MKLMRLVGAATMAGMASVAFASSALASDVSLATTGPDSDQSVKIDNSTSTDINNTSIVTIDNANVQDATTGDVTADKNTSVEGGAGSGNATNVNGTSTSVQVNNETPAGAPGHGGSGGAGGAGGAGGSTLGASTGGSGEAAMLPEVGAKFPVDVSALRNAWNAAAAPTTALVDQTRGLRIALLALAMVMTMIGAVGSFAYGRFSPRTL